jgi:hypothetical protein
LTGRGSSSQLEPRAPSPHMHLLKVSKHSSLYHSPPPPPIANSTAPRSTVPTLSFQLPHTHNTSPPIMPQDMPPTGGYEPVQYKRNLPARGFRPATYLLMVGAVCTYGFWRVGQGIREQKYACYCSNTPSDLCTPRKH